MNAYASSVSLVEEIKRRWNAAAAPGDFSLPDDRTLTCLLETCYHASLRTTEHRPVHCVLAYASPDRVPRKSLLLFDRPVGLTRGELVRLSPVTELHRSLIGCDGSDGNLSIWGVFEHERAWVQLSKGEPPETPIEREDLPPDWLTVTMEQPGSLSVARGSRTLVRLREGRIIRPQENPLREKDRPLGMFFDQLVRDLWHLPRHRARLESTPGDDGPRTLLDIYTTSIAAILERIRSDRHGGSVVIARPRLDDALAQVTYRVVRHTPLSDQIVDYYEALSLAAETSRPPSRQEDGQADEVAGFQVAARLRHASQQLAAGISQISVLTAIDGAVLLDGHLQIDGFGARFPVLPTCGATVVDALSGIEYACDEWGLRHQSIFSLCQKCEEAVGLVVSQDGGVKAVKSVDGKLHLWDGLLD